jgi:hypothetical protein
MKTWKRAGLELITFAGATIAFGFLVRWAQVALLALVRLASE